MKYDKSTWIFNYIWTVKIYVEQSIFVIVKMTDRDGTWPLSVMVWE